MIKSAVFSPHHYCNSSCWMCTSLRVNHRDFIEPDYDVIKNAVTELYASGVRAIHISGGEPTIWKRYKDFMEFVGSVGFSDIGVYTHGRALTPRLVEDSLNAGVNLFLVSLHAADEGVGDRIANARGSFRQTLRGLDVLSKAKIKRDFRISISFVMSALTEKSIDSVVSTAMEFPIDAFQFTYPMHSSKGDTHDVSMYPNLGEINLDNHVSRLKSSNIIVNINEVPPCFYRNHPDCYSGFEIQSSSRVLGGYHSIKGLAEPVTYEPIRSAEVGRKVQECSSCYFESVCHGVPETYFERFDKLSLSPVTRDEALLVAARRAGAALSSNTKHK